MSWRAHTICKHDRLDEESEKINNYCERINDKTSKVSLNIVINIIDRGHQQNSEFAMRMIEKLTYKGHLVTKFKRISVRIYMLYLILKH